MECQFVRREADWCLVKDKGMDPEVTTGVVRSLPYESHESGRRSTMKYHQLRALEYSEKVLTMKDDGNL